MGRGGIELRRIFWSIVLVLSLTIFQATTNTTMAGLGFIQCPKVLAEKMIPNRSFEEGSVNTPRQHLLKNEWVPFSPVKSSILSFWNVPPTPPFEDEDHLEPQVMHTLIMKVNNH